MASVTAVAAAAHLILATHSMWRYRWPEALCLSLCHWHHLQPHHQPRFRFLPRFQLLSLNRWQRLYCRHSHYSPLSSVRWQSCLVNDSRWAARRRCRTCCPFKVKVDVGVSATAAARPPTATDLPTVRSFVRSFFPFVSLSVRLVLPLPLSAQLTLPHRALSYCRVGALVLPTERAREWEWE